MRGWFGALLRNLTSLFGGWLALALRAGVGLAFGAGINFFGGAKSLEIHFSSHISRVKYNFPSHMPQAPNPTCTLGPYHFHIIILL